MKKFTLWFLSFFGVLLLTACEASHEHVQKTDLAKDKKQEHSEHSRMGSHGMAVIGENNLLFHHMPLYRKPHDRQILIPVRFVETENKTAFAEWRENYRGLVSIVPENFDLNRLDPLSTNPIKNFSADIYQGHFERGGELKFKAVQFVLQQAIFHRAVEADRKAKAVFTYVEHVDKAYLVSDIGPRPSKDWVLEVLPIATVATGERLTAATVVDNQEKVLFKRMDGSGVNIRLVNTVYLETMDFQ